MNIRCKNVFNISSLTFDLFLKTERNSYADSLNFWDVNSSKLGTDERRNDKLLSSFQCIHFSFKNNLR